MIVLLPQKQVQILSTFGFVGEIQKFVTANFLLINQMISVLLNSSSGYLIAPHPSQPGAAPSG
jgi:hypothetical protein